MRSTAAPLPIAPRFSATPGRSKGRCDAALERHDDHARANDGAGVRPPQASARGRRAATNPQQRDERRGGDVERAIAVAAERSGQSCEQREELGSLTGTGPHATQLVHDARAHSLAGKIRERVFQPIGFRQRGARDRHVHRPVAGKRHLEPAGHSPAENADPVVASRCALLAPPLESEQASSGHALSRSALQIRNPQSAIDKV